MGNRIGGVLKKVQVSHHWQDTLICAGNYN